MYYLNGVISSEELLNEDFFYGYSLFETMYGMNGKVLFLNEHINRMLESAKLIGINIKNDINKDINIIFFICRNYRWGGVITLFITAKLGLHHSILKKSRCTSQA